MRTLPWENYSPNNWENWRLKFAAPLTTDRGNQDLQQLEYLGMENVESWTGKLVRSELNDELNEEKDTLQITGIAFDSYHVLFGKLRPYLAKVFLPNSSGICSTEFLVLEPIKSINRKYLFYVLLTKEFIATVNASTFGSKMPRANWDFIGSQSVPVPPISEQNKIVNYLDRETTQIDNLIAAKEQMLTLLEEKREALISHAVTRGLDPNVAFKRSGLDWLGDIPKHWNIQKVKHSFEIVLGKMLEPTQRTNNDIEVPYLKALHIHWDGVIFQYLLNMWANQTEIRHLKLKQGDLLVCEGGEVGRATILNIELPPNTIIQNSLHRVRSKESGENRFLRYLLRHASTKGVIDVLCNRATIGHFTVEKFREFLFALPPKNEQILIADYLDYETSKIDELLSAIKESIALLKERRSALITAAVTGQIALEEMTS